MINEHKVVQQDLSASSSALPPSLLPSTCLPPFPMQLSSALPDGLPLLWSQSSSFKTLALIAVKMLSTCMFHNFSYCAREHPFIAFKSTIRKETKLCLTVAFSCLPTKTVSCPSALKKRNHHYYNFHFYPAPTFTQIYVAGK